jgi:hypothetical protein
MEFILMFDVFQLLKLKDDEIETKKENNYAKK